MDKILKVFNIGLLFWQIILFVFIIGITFFLFKIYRAIIKKIL